MKYAKMRKGRARNAPTVEPAISHDDRRANKRPSGAVFAVDDANSVPDICRMLESQI